MIFEKLGIRNRIVIHPVVPAALLDHRPHIAERAIVLRGNRKPINLRRFGTDDSFAQKIETMPLESQFHTTLVAQTLHEGRIIRFRNPRHIVPGTDCVERLAW